MATMNLKWREIGTDVGDEMRRGGFTLLELVLVVIIIGVIGAIAMPRVSSGQQRARFTSTWATYRNLERAAGLYQADWQSWPGDVLKGVCPPGMQNYVEVTTWTKPTPIGGLWDWNYNFNAATWAPESFWVGYPPSIAINRASADTLTLSRMIALDAQFDDGVATTGQLRRVGATHLIYPVEK